MKNIENRKVFDFLKMNKNKCPKSECPKSPY